MKNIVLFSAFQYIGKANYKFCLFWDECTLTLHPAYGVSMYMKRGKYELLLSFQLSCRVSVSCIGSVLVVLEYIVTLGNGGEGGNFQASQYIQIQR